MKITKKNKSLVFTSNSKLTILINTLKTLDKGVLGKC